MDALVANEKRASFPYLSANILKKDTDELAFTANKVIELADGTKVGFFGLTTPSTPNSTAPKHVEDFTFLRGSDLYAAAQDQVNELRGAGCALVVCVGHLGNVGRGEGSKDVLQNVTGIDLFIDGHDHQEVEEEVEGALLVETGCHLHNIGVVVIDEGMPQNEPVAYGTYDGIDEATQAIIDEENARVEQELGVVLGETPFFLDGERANVRMRETNLGDFCADALKWTAEQELGRQIDGSIVNGGGIRISVEAGDISLKTIKTVMPFSNELSVLDVTGAQLLEALEAACQGVPDYELGSFSHVSGITFTVDASVPYEDGPVYPDSIYAAPANPGARVTITAVGGRGFDEDETYTISSLSYLFEGGGTYHACKDVTDVKPATTFGFDYEALTSYLVEACDHTVPDEYAGPQGRVTIVGV